MTRQQFSGKKIWRLPQITVLRCCLGVTILEGVEKSHLSTLFRTGKAVVRV